MALADIRSKLRRLEDTICLSLFERLQYRRNIAAYTPGGVSVPGFERSFFEYLFRGTEELHGSAGRYDDPEERSFFIKSAVPMIPRKKDSYVEIKPVVNLNPVILRDYMSLLDDLCEEGDDESSYGSAIVADIYCLQAISRRVHIGEQVAEAKYQKDSAVYERLISAGDEDGIVAQLRNVGVEQENLKRIREKSERYGVPTDVIAGFFEEKIMPLTIRAEVLYFMNKGK